MTNRLDEIRSLEKLPLAAAQTLALKIIDTFNPKNIQGKASKNRIIYDINSARKSSDICAIMYRLQLANEGLGVTDSSWQKHYRSI
jgi:hypothetical protein